MRLSAKVFSVAFAGFTCAAIIALALPAAAQEVVEGRVTHVRDVDTIEVRGIPIRLRGVDGPELDTSIGAKGKRELQALVRGKRVSCQLNGQKTHDRYVGMCSLDGVDLGRWAIEQGLARRCPRFDRRASDGWPAQYKGMRENGALPRARYC